MARHSKWHNIKHKKASVDAKKGKSFTKHAKMICLAVKQSGADISMNPILRSAIEEAKADNFPNENIERAIKKGSGELKEGQLFEEIFYDCFGPGGVAIIVQVMTDNRNRSITNVRSILTKNGGRLADTGSVVWMFKKMGYCFLEGESSDLDEAELIAIEVGAKDVKRENGVLHIFTDAENLMNIKQNISFKCKSPVHSKLTFQSDNKKVIELNGNTHKQLEILLEKLEENEDVANVYTNAQIV